MGRGTERRREAARDNEPQDQAGEKECRSKAARDNETKLKMRGSIGAQEGGEAGEVSSIFFF